LKAVPLKAGLMAGLALLLEGCGLFGGGSSSGVTPPHATYLGSVSTEDPQATEAARQVLASGGSAADAMAAAGMVLSITLPSRAGLAGGGVCLVQKPDGTTQEVDFLPKSVPGASIPIPGMVRGLAALQAKFGRQRWQEAVAKAEWLALNGAPASRALADDMKSAGIAGESASDGGVIAQPQAAPLYTALRIAGPQDFYAGRIAANLVATGIPASELASYAPQLQDIKPVLSTRHGMIAFTRNGGGRAAAAAWRAISAASDQSQPYAIARQAIGGTEAPAASTAVLVTDTSGLAVGCAFTMGRLWGNGQIVPGLGIYGAAPIDDAADRGIVAAIVSSHSGQETDAVFAGGASTAVPADVAAIAWTAINGKTALDQAMANARTPQEAEPGFTVPSRVQGLYCPGGVHDKPDSCAVVSDPRGGGFAVNAVSIQQQ
jgi:gamma-glutamyltranspeptidase/glutathione hydrolase